MSILSNNRISKTLFMSPTIKKILLSVLIILIYFFVWRTIRSSILEYGIKPYLTEFLQPTEGQEITMRENNSLSYFIHLNNTKSGLKEYILKVPGGIFFLMGNLALLFFVGTERKIFITYVSIQFIVMLLNFAFLFFGLFVHFSGIFVVDLLGQYGEPIVNLGFVLFFIQEKKKAVLLNSK
jgi:hypothetical protein